MFRPVPLRYSRVLKIASLFCLTCPASAGYFAFDIGALGGSASVAQGVTDFNAEGSGSSLTRAPQINDAVEDGVELAGAYHALLTPTALVPEPPTLLLAGVGPPTLHLAAVGGICLAAWALARYAVRSLWTGFTAARRNRKVERMCTRPDHRKLRGVGYRRWRYTT